MKKQNTDLQNKKLIISIITCLGIFGVGYLSHKILTRPKEKIVIKKEVKCQNLKAEEILLTSYNENLKLFISNSAKIQEEFKELLKYMNSFHNLVKPLVDNISAIKAGKLVSSFFVPGAVIEFLDVIVDGVDFINSVDNEILIYTKATDNSKLKKVINLLNEYKNNPNNILLIKKIEKEVLQYIFYMYRLKNSLEEVVKILDTIYKTYINLNSKASFLMKKLGMSSDKDLIGLKEDIEHIQSIIDKNKKLIDKNIQLVNKVESITVGYEQILIFKLKEKCKAGDKNSCNKLDIFKEK